MENKIVISTCINKELCHRAKYEGISWAKAIEDGVLLNLNKLSSKDKLKAALEQKNKEIEEISYQLKKVEEEELKKLQKEQRKQELLNNSIIQESLNILKEKGYSYAKGRCNLIKSKTGLELSEDELINLCMEVKNDNED